eukprot:9042893-Ditylum_brightwellii.AAC.1
MRNNNQNHNKRNNRRGGGKRKQNQGNNDKNDRPYPPSCQRRNPSVKFNPYKGTIFTKLQSTGRP